MTVEAEQETDIVEQTEQKLRRVRQRHAVSTLLHNIGLLLKMLRDRSFDMTWPTRGMILGALLYFVVPTDATPDYIPIIGYIDDTAIVAMVIKRLSREIERYREHIAWS